MKYTKRDKNKILNYFWKKANEYSSLTDKEINEIYKTGIHNNKKLSSTEWLALKKTSLQKNNLKT